MQPRAEVGARLEAAELPVRLQEGVLHHVIGVLRIARHPVREPVDSPAVTVDQGPEGVAVTVAGQRDGGGVRIRHPSN